MNSTEYESWASALINKIDPRFQHRWIVYSNELESLLNKDSIWLDCGCGANGMISEFGDRVKFACGIDVEPEKIEDRRFVRADILALPFPDECADVITLRFVVEHFVNPDEAFRELRRVLKKDGMVLLITTNINSPLIFAARLLPFPLKNQLIARVYRVRHDDIFPTYHRLNSATAIQNKLAGFTLTKLLFLSDLNFERKTVFLLLLLWHRLTLLTGWKKLRTNILAVLKKS